MNRKKEIIADFAPIGVLRLLGLTPKTYMEMYKKEMEKAKKKKK